MVDEHQDQPAPNADQPPAPSPVAENDSESTSPDPIKPEALAEIELSGHIIDSLMLPKILDRIVVLGGRFHIREIQIGHERHDASSARIQVAADTEELLEEILNEISRHGAVAIDQVDCQLQAAQKDGVFPEGFYCSTNQDTEIRIDGHWQPVADQEMDCGIVYDPKHSLARCCPMSDVKQGQLVVIGRQGTRVRPLRREVETYDGFQFMNSTVSSEKPKGLIIRDIAAEMVKARDGHGKVLIVAGPAVVHTGSRDYFVRLIQGRFVNVLFAGNALATHDIEQSFYGTSLGVSMSSGRSMEEGHEHHLRSINRIRDLGGIKPAVAAGVLTSGIMYEAVKANVPYLLAGSIRDDGPLPDVVTDVIDAQRQMRELLPGVTCCLMIATTLHSIAVGNLLPARVKVVCVDINQATVTKLSDRGTFQTIGLVTDVEPFLRSLLSELDQLTADRQS